jgi:heme/copper-type cytochrome/quinol oxidase subunit 2
MSFFSSFPNFNQRRFKFMEERAYIALSFVAVILGVSALGIGTYSVINFQMVEGPQGASGLNGTDGLNGQDAPGGIIVGIVDPDYGDTISENITIRAIVYGSETYSVSIFGNGSEIGTYLPMEWNSTTVNDGWWNITIVVTDIATNNMSSDEVIVFIKNYDVMYVNIMPNLIIPENTEVIFNLAAESVVHRPDSLTNGAYCLYRFLLPKNYVTTENIIFHLVWGAPTLSPTIDYAINFYYSTDGNSDTSFDFTQSSWTGAGQNRRNFESLTINNIATNLGIILTVKVYMEDQNGLDETFCYSVWLEIPVD